MIAFARTTQDLHDRERITNTIGQTKAQTESETITHITEVI